MLLYMTLVESMRFYKVRCLEVRTPATIFAPLGWLATGVVCATLLAAPVATAQAPAPRTSGYLILRESYARDAALTATLHRARIQTDGSLPQRFSYRILVEYAAATGARTPSTVSLRDASIRWNRASLSAQAGQFKTPFAREYVLPVPDLETAEFATVIDSLAPKYDIGFMGEWAAPYASVSLGVFNGEGQNVSANRDSAMLVVGRLVARPFAPISLGGSVARYSPDSTRYGVEGVAEWHGLYTRAELIGQHKRGRTRDDQGWYVLSTVRLLPWLRAVGRVEDFQRPSLGQARRISAMTAGLDVELPGGRTRFLVNQTARRTGYPRIQRNSVIGQIQVRF